MRWWVKSLLFCCLFSQQANGQYDFPDTLNRKKLGWLTGAESALFATTFSGLYFVWYDNQSFVPMHSFDDSREWLQMDKAGHFMSASVIADHSSFFYRKCGVKKRNADLLGAAQSMLYLSTLEIFDSFSAGWGFSWTDMLANAAGNVFFLGQEMLWNEQRFVLKFSAHLTNFAQYRPSLLGSAFTERILKDYNGQTYWIMASPFSFMKKESKFPSWLGFALGYGGEGMLGGNANPYVNEQGERLPQYSRYRQFYLSPDIDLSKISVKKRWLRTTLKLLNVVKLPLPALEYSNSSLRFHAIYF